MSYLSSRRTTRNASAESGGWLERLPHQRRREVNTMIGLLREMPPGEMDAACERGTGRTLPRLHARPATHRMNAVQRGRRAALDGGVTSIASRRAVGSDEEVAPAPRITGRRHA